MAKGQFHALAGSELKEIILQRAQAKIEELPIGFQAKAKVLEALVRNLDRDTRFEYHNAYPQVRWDLTLNVKGLPDQKTIAWAALITIEAYPQDPPSFTIEYGGTIQDAGPTSIVTTEHRPERAGDPEQPSRFVDGAMTKPPEQVSLEPTEQPEGDKSDLRPNAIDPRTAHGLDIETGAEPFSIAMLPHDEQEGIAKERELGDRHNERVLREMAAGQTVTLTDGETIVKPNAARREAGLPIPSMRKTDSGEVVDRTLDESF